MSGAQIPEVAERRHGVPRRRVADEKPAGRPAVADYRALFDQSEIPVALVSALGEPRFVAVSRGFLDTFELKRAAVVGRSVDLLFPSPDTPALTAAIRRCLAMSETVHASAELRNGAHHHVTGLAAHPTRARGFAGHVVVEVEGPGHTIFSQIRRLLGPIDREGGPAQAITYVYDLRRQRLRHTEGPLTRRLGLHGRLSREDFRAMIHPDDHPLLAAFEGRARPAAGRKVHHLDPAPARRRE